MLRVCARVLVVVLVSIQVVGCALTSSSRTPRSGLSASRLSIHLLGRYTEGAHRIVAAGPRVIKVLDPQSNGDMMAALVDYKTRWLEGVTVVRVWEGTPGIRFGLTDDPVASAARYWDRILAPAMSRLTPAQRSLIDFLEGPNEGENCPTWQDLASAAWYGAFSAALAGHMAEAGFRPCLACIPVGNPPGDRDEMRAKLDAFVPALEAARRLNGCWAYHSYSIGYTTDVAEEMWYALRYRQFYRFLEDEHPHLADLPLILTESGIDHAGNKDADGWQARGSAERFQEWLLWYDSELNRDEYVIGSTLFQSGDPAGWPSFEIEPVALWLAGHIAGARGGPTP